VIEDFVRSPYGAAIVGNSSTKLIGQPGGESVEGLRVHLRLTDRQVEQVRRLSRTPRYHEFLLIQGDRNNVVRVPADPFSKWVFTTSPKDRERLSRLAEERPDLSLLEMVRLLAAETRFETRSVRLWDLSSRVRTPSHGPQCRKYQDRKKLADAYCWHSLCFFAWMDCVGGCS